MRIRRRLLTAAVAAVALFGAPRQARADVIVYSISGTASGQIGASTFTNALVTLSLTGNTTGVVTALGIFANTGVATISIAGIGTATITDPTAIYASPTPNPLGDLGTFPFVFFGTLDSPPSIDDATGLGGIASNALLGYDLKSAFGPLTTSPAGVGRPLGVIAHTTLGNLTFAQDLAPTSTGTFRAVIVASPEPSSVVLLMTGGVLLIGVRARRAPRKQRVNWLAE